MKNDFNMRLLNDDEQMKISGGENTCTKTGDVITHLCSGGSDYTTVRQCMYLECTCSQSVTVDENGALHCEGNVTVKRDCSYPVTPLGDIDYNLPPKP